MAVQNEEAERVPTSERPGADVIALPQLERLPTTADEASAGFRGLDSRSSRLEALELVRAAVELADRIERDAQDTAKDRLARIEEEVRLRRASLDEQEAALERGRRELESTRQEVEARLRELEAKQQELEQYRQQVVEATETLQARAEQEAAEAVAKATAQAQALLEQSQREAARLAETVRNEASAVTQAAHTEAERMAQLAEAARTEAEQLTQAAHARAERIAHPAPSDVEQLLTLGSGAAAPLAVPETPSAEPDVQVELDREGPESGATISGDSNPAPEAAPREAEEQTNQAAPQAFTPPPVSVEDLATVSSLPRLGIRSRLRDR